MSGIIHQRLLFLFFTATIFGEIRFLVAASESWFNLSQALTLESLQADNNPTGFSHLNIPASAAFILDNGFPIPQLEAIDPNPSFSSDELEKCPYIRATNRSPKNNTLIYLTLSIDEILGSNDVQKTVSFSSAVLLQWAVDNCDGSETIPNAKKSETFNIKNVEQIWRPRILFLNATNDIRLQSANLGESLYGMHLPTEPSRLFYFHWNRIGRLNTLCRYDLSSYPFDRVYCDLTWAFEETAQFVNFGGIHVNLADESLVNHEQWQLTAYESHIFTDASIIYRGQSASYAKVTIVLRRNAGYFVANLMAPCLVLIVIIIGSLIAPSSIDRAAFTGTVLLSVMITQTIVLQQLPKTSQSILFADYVQTLTGLGGIVTAYHVVMCGIPHYITESKMKTSSSCMASLLRGLSNGRAMDIVALLAAMCYLSLTNLWATLKIYA